MLYGEPLINSHALGEKSGRFGLPGVLFPSYVTDIGPSARCRAPSPILGSATPGRSAAIGDTAALGYGLLGLGVVAMIAFLPRLFRWFRPQEPAWIESDELQRRLAAGDPVMLLDVRQPNEFTGPPGHLPGAVNIPLAELAARTPDLARRKQAIVVVCKTDRRSARAPADLSAAGLKDVTVLRGGTDGWHQRGLTLE
jgi:rhodanese-related sulfurtransferase